MTFYTCIMLKAARQSNSLSNWPYHYSDVIMSMMPSQITGVSIVYSTVCSGEDQRKPQSSASLAFVRGSHQWPVNSPHKEPVTRKMFPFDDVIMAIAAKMADILLMIFWNAFVFNFSRIMIAISQSLITRVWLAKSPGHEYIWASASHK